MKRLGIAISMILPIALLAGSGWAFLNDSPGHTSPAPDRVTRSTRQHTLGPARCPQVTPPLVGVAPAAPWYRSFERFAQATGVHPNLASKYEAFGSAFDASLARDMASQGTLLLIQLNPRHASLSQIAHGHYDTYLRTYAEAVRAFHCPVMLSFAHEMNGPWFPWGRGHQSASAWKAAYRHLHDVFTRIGARNVTWVWNPDRAYSASAWWPGARYVNVVAFDGYYWLPRYTFADLYARALRQAARIAPGKPVMIAETGAYPGPGMAGRVRNLMAGVLTGHLAGIVYFEHNGHHADWRLEGHPAAIAAFRAGVQALQRKAKQLVS